MPEWTPHQFGSNRYYQREFHAPFGRFSFRVFKNGTLNIYVDAKAPGLDADGLVQVLMCVNAEIFNLTGRHVTPDQILVRGPTEYNYDSVDPSVRDLLRIEGVKSAYTYSQLLGAYWRVYEKGDKTRIETGGQPLSAGLLHRALRTPVQSLESLALMPGMLNQIVNNLVDVSQQIDVATKGMASFQQRQASTEEGQRMLIANITTLTGYLKELLEVLVTPTELRGKQ